MTVQFYAVGCTISEDCAKYVTKSPGLVIGNTILKTQEVKCGRGLAPDSGVPVSISATDPPLSGASPLPHWFFAWRWIGSDAEGLDGSVELAAQHQQVFTLAAALADAQQIVLT